MVRQLPMPAFAQSAPRLTPTGAVTFLGGGANIQLFRRWMIAEKVVIPAASKRASHMPIECSRNLAAAVNELVVSVQNYALEVEKTCRPKPWLKYCE